MNDKDIETYEIELVSQFEKDIKHFVRKKKFASLPSQIKYIAEELKRGVFGGVLMSHSETPVPHDIYKMRLPNLDTNAGKSNGYRVIYAVITETKIIVLLTIYYKKEQIDVEDTYIDGLIDGYFMSQLSFNENESDISVE